MREGELSELWGRLCRGRVKNQIRDQRWLAGSRPNGGFKEKIGI